MPSNKEIVTDEDGKREIETLPNGVRIGHLIEPSASWKAKVVPNPHVINRNLFTREDGKIYFRAADGAIKELTI